MLETAEMMYQGPRHHRWVDRSSASSLWLESTPSRTCRGTQARSEVGARLDTLTEPPGSGAAGYSVPILRLTSTGDGRVPGRWSEFVDKAAKATDAVRDPEGRQHLKERASQVGKAAAAKAPDSLRDPERRRRLAEQASRVGKAVVGGALDDVTGKDGQIKKRKVARRALRPVKTFRRASQRASSAALRETRDLVLGQSARTPARSRGSSGSDMELADDPDIAAVLEGNAVDRDLLAPPDRKRVDAFLDAMNRAVDQDTHGALHVAGEAGIAAYQDRSPSMPLGFEKFIVANVGICGTQLWDDHGLGPDSDPYLLFAAHEITARGWRPDGDHTLLGAHCSYITATLAENGYLFERAPNANS